ncbi:MAG: NAD-dependent deacylase [Ardenticatenia bacterium]|nr:NAD-dependent deacylase [Ardenticatenia bacterium]
MGNHLLAAHHDLISRVAEALRRAHHVAVLTGAGVSAESGVPTFRDAQTGLWARYSPEELATPQAFERTPHLVWAWYRWRRDRIRRAVPNSAHRALVEVEHRAPRFTLITQNVDGLHHRAGSRRVIELHGNIMRTKCSREGIIVHTWDEPEDDAPPMCPRCGAYLRPDVVWFGEMLPQEALRAALEAATSADLFFVVGTSAVVQPAASLPVEAARHGATVVEVNVEPTPVTRLAHYVLTGPAGTVLPALVRAAWPTP